MSLLLIFLVLNITLHGIIVARFGIRNNLPVFVFMIGPRCSPGSAR